MEIGFSDTVLGVPLEAYTQAHPQEREAIPVTAEMLLEAYYRLDASAKYLRAVLADNLFWAVDPFHIDDQGPHRAPALLHGLTNFQYEQYQDARTTLKYPGAIGTSMEGVLAAKELNDHKALFSELAANYRKQVGKTANIQGTMMETVERMPLESRRPFQMGPLAHLHLNQASRKIPLSETTPRLVSWSWDTAKRAIRKNTAAEAADLIKKKGYQSDAAQTQYEQLGRMGNEPIAIIQNLPPSLFVTTTLTPREADRGEITGLSTRTKRPASLPLIYLFNKEQPTRFRFHKPDLTDRENQDRSTRGDSAWEDTPAFSVINAHVRKKL